MKNRKIPIAISLVLLMLLGGISCDTANNTNNEKQNANAKKTTEDNNTVKKNIQSPKENDVVDESLEENKLDNTLPEIVEEPTKQPPVEENTTKNEVVTPEVKNQVPIVGEKTPAAENKTPTINNPPQGITNDQFMPNVESLIFKRVNEERAKAGVPALTYNTTMEKYARIKSKDMGDRGYFSHNDPEGRLITENMRGDGVSYRTWGENIAYISGVSDEAALANQFMTNWMNSQGHRENILSTNFSGIGVGVYKIGNKVYATQEFYR